MNARPHDLHRTRFVPRRSSFVAALLPLLVACSAGAMQISKSANDPSSPSAPAGADPMLTASSAPSSGQPHVHHDHAAHAGASSDASPSGAPSTTDASASDVVYTCPMHPEVTSTKPGDVCPKCNMKLVPKK